MLSKGDDYPLHQLPEPVATAGSDRNFYDRYYFGGSSPDGGVYFVAGLGVYPHLDLMDAAFMIQRQSRQESLIASRHLGGERMDTQVAPIAVEVREPLQRLAVTIAANEHGIEGELEFTGLAPPIEEPRFIHRQGPRTILDLTRMTQGGRWQGWVRSAAGRVEVKDWPGIRDRSWGVRPIGAKDGQPVPGAGLPQWYWLWAPAQFDDHLFFFHTNDDGAGRPWNRSAVLVPLATGLPLHLRDAQIEVRYRPGTRQVGEAQITGLLPDGRPVAVDYAVEGIVYLQGAGYNHPAWGHGSYHGAHALHHQTLDCAALEPNSFEQIHSQTPSRVTLRIGDEAPRAGRGIFEQMLLGEHKTSGLTGILDPVK